jgi:ribulose-bisphosphate carboxylase large chain
MQDVMATYYFRPREDTSPVEAAQAICEEQTTGTWTSISTRAAYVQRLDGVVESITPHQQGFIAEIRYPVELFDPGNVAQYLSVFAGNLFGLERLRSVRLLDVTYPEELARFHGPRFGVSGIRRLVGTTKRPHIGTIIKPKVGLNPKDTAEVAYEAAMGGVDLIKDDETLTDQHFCPFAERLPLVMARLDEAREETGQQVLYAVNVTTRADRIVARAEEVIGLGANMILVDVLTAGFGALQALGEDPAIRVPIHVHRTMHAAMTRNKEHGIAWRPLARLVRMLGGDQLHTGTVSGKMSHAAEEVIGDNEALLAPFHAFKRTFPVASGGLHPGKVDAELRTLGTEITLQAGGGIHGHPDGTRAGARAMRQAVDAFMAGVPAGVYAEKHYELDRALKHWGLT